MSSSAASPSFDWSKISLSTRIAGGGAIVLLVSAFMNWVHVSAGPISASQSGWSAYTLGKLAALAAVVAIAVIVIEQVRPDVTLPVHPALALVGCGAVGIFCALWRIVFVPDSGVSGIDVGPSYGVFVALVAAGVLAYGGWRRMSEA
jgi:hypothetical protein